MVGVFLFIPQSDLIHASLSCPVGDNLTALPPPEIFALWDEAALQWACETYNSPELRTVRERYVDIQRQLKTEPRGPKRTQLVNAAFELRYKS